MKNFDFTILLKPRNKEILRGLLKEFKIPFEPSEDGLNKLIAASANDSQILLRVAELFHPEREFWIVTSSRLTLVVDAKQRIVVSHLGTKLKPEQLMNVIRFSDLIPDEVLDVVRMRASS